LPFKTLYNRRQTEGVHLPLNWYVEDAKELSWVENSIQIKRTAALPKSYLRGFIVRHNPGFMPHAMSSNYTIFIADGLSREFERFVIIKELMHLYFGPNGGGIYATDNAVVFENHMQEMFAASADIRSHQVEGEKRGLWMAISVLTPENERQAFLQRMAADEMSVEDVAAILKVPIHTTKALLSSQYDQEISNILE
jgi:hypothetical protein